MRNEIPNCRFPENCVNKLITEAKVVPVWVAFTHGNAVSQKAALYLLCEGISFFTRALNELPNIPLQNPREQWQQTVPRSEGWNCVWWSHTSESNLSKSISVVTMWGHFLLHRGPLRAAKYHFPDSTKIVLANCFLNSKLKIGEMTSQVRKKFLRKLLSRFERMKFLYEGRLQCYPKKPFSGSWKRV